MQKDCHHPLLFEPGTGWAYGPGFDWAGRIVSLPHSPYLVADTL